jgi:hypothetical protein
LTVGILIPRFHSHAAAWDERNQKPDTSGFARSELAED